MIGGLRKGLGILFALAIITAIIATSGCAHRAANLRKVRLAYLSGDLDVADQHLDKLIGKRHKKQELLLADKAMISLLRGDVETSEELLREVRDGFDHLEQMDVTEAALSTLTDDRRRAYAGEEYERILVRNFLAIANLLGEGDDALAYCFQANEKQQRLIGPPIANNAGESKVPWQRVCLADYLYGVIQEETHVNYDDAHRAYATIAQANPAFHTATQDLDRVQTAEHSARGNGVVYVIALVGPGPVKEEVVAPVTSQSLAIAAQLLSAFGDRDVPPFSAPVKIPQVVVPRSVVDGVLISVDGQQSGVTETITDIGRLAFECGQADRDRTIARAVVRRVMKKAAVYKAKDELATNTWSGLAMDAGSFLWEAAESADTRCWSTLPGTIQILRCELPAGTMHEISLSPVAHGRIIGATRSRRFQVSDGRNTYILASFPDENLAGTILASK